MVLMHLSVSELAGGYVVNDLLCMLEQPYLRKNFVDDIVRLLLDIVKDTKSQVQPVCFWQCCGSGIRCLFDPWIRDG
jgi:hypothetical protein